MIRPSSESNKLHQSTFLRKFEGKINVVTRESGLRGVLMKTIKNSNRSRYHNEK